jgi:hypothetical protein
MHMCYMCDVSPEHSPASDHRVTGISATWLSSPPCVQYMKATLVARAVQVELAVLFRTSAFTTYKEQVAAYSDHGWLGPCMCVVQQGAEGLCRMLDDCTCPPT